MSCPACRFPVAEDQPQMRVHMGVTQDADGYMVDLLPTFHRPCAASYLIAKGRAKTEALRVSRPSNVFSLPMRWLEELAA